MSVRNPQSAIRNPQSAIRNPKPSRIATAVSCVLACSHFSTANALPTFAELAGTWKTDQGDEFTIDSDGRVSGLRVYGCAPNTDCWWADIGQHDPFNYDLYTTGSGFHIGSGTRLGELGFSWWTISAWFNFNGNGPEYNSGNVNYSTQYCTISNGCRYGGGATPATKIVATTAAIVTVTPTNLAFGNQAVATTSTISNITLTNTGTATANGIAVATTGDYARAGGSCGATLAAANTCTIGITFTPTVTGTRTGTVTVNSSNASSVSTNLTGNGVAATTAVLSSSLANLSFSDQTIGTTSAAETVTIINTGTATANGIAVATTGDYTRSGGTCGTTLAAADTCTIGITFTPTATGTRTGTVTVNSSNATSVSTNLTGNGVAATTAVLSSSLANLSFSDQTIGTTSAVKTVTIINTGTATANGINVATTGDYARSGGTCGTTLAATGTCTIGITFTPTAAGTRTGTVTVNSSNATSVSANLTGTGSTVANPDVLGLSSTNISFANQTVTVGTTSAAQTVTLTNTGAVAITGIATTITGDYARDGGTCITTLAAAGTCTIGVAFRPTAAGTRTGSLTITSTNAATVTATLTGTASGGGVTPTGVKAVPVLGIPALSLLTMLLTSLVGWAGFRKNDT